MSTYARRLGVSVRQIEEDAAVDYLRARLFP